MRGRVKWWNRSGGCGFIELSETDSIFISLTKEDQKEIKIEENQLIEFEIIRNTQGNFLKILNKKSEVLGV